MLRLADVSEAACHSSALAKPPNRCGLGHHVPNAAADSSSTGTRTSGASQTSRRSGAHVVGFNGLVACSASCISRRSSPSMHPTKFSKANRQSSQPRSSSCLLSGLNSSGALTCFEKLLRLWASTSPCSASISCCPASMTSHLVDSQRSHSSFLAHVCYTRRLRYHENDRARFHACSEPQCSDRLGHANLLCIVPRLAFHATCTSQQKQQNKHPPKRRNTARNFVLEGFCDVSPFCANSLVVFSLE